MDYHTCINLKGMLFESLDKLLCHCRCHPMVNFLSWIIAWLNHLSHPFVSMHWLKKQDPLRWFELPVDFLYLDILLPHYESLPYFHRLKWSLKCELSSHQVSMLTQFLYRCHCQLIQLGISIIFLGHIHINYILKAHFCADILPNPN